MFRKFVLGAFALAAAWGIAFERPTSEAQASHRRRCCNSYSSCGSYSTGCNTGYSSCGYRGRSHRHCGYRNCGYSTCGSSSCAPQYTTASYCGGGYTNQCGYTATTAADGTQYTTPNGAAPQYNNGRAEDVAPPPAPATSAPLAPQPSTTPPPAPAPGA